MSRRNKFNRYKKYISTLQAEVPYLFADKANPVVLGIGSFEPLTHLTSLSNTVLRDVLSVWCSRIEYHKAMVDNRNCAYLEMDDNKHKAVIKWCRITNKRKSFAIDQLQRRVNNNPLLYRRYKLEKYGEVKCNVHTMSVSSSTPKQSTMMGTSSGTKSNVKSGQHLNLVKPVLMS